MFRLPYKIKLLFVFVLITVSSCNDDADVHYGNSGDSGNSRYINLEELQRMPKAYEKIKAVERGLKTSRNVSYSNCTQPHPDKGI